MLYKDFKQWNIYLWQGRQGKWIRKDPTRRGKGSDIALVLALSSKSMHLHSFIKLRNLYMLHGKFYRCQTIQGKMCFEIFGWLFLKYKAYGIKGFRDTASINNN